MALLFAFFIPKGNDSKIWFDNVGFYSIFLTFILWCIALWRGWTELPQHFGNNKAAKDIWPPLVAAAFIVSLAFMVSPPDFRVLNDELYLLGTSLGMFENHKLSMPDQGLRTSCFFLPFEMRLDKRPLAWPFLLYILHSLRGFRPDNAFILNFLVSSMCLFTLHHLALRWFNRPTAWLAMLTLASIPIYILWTTSGGFEILNILFLLMSALFMDRFITHRTARSFELLIITLAILAQCRYESMIFAVVMFIAAVLYLPKKQYAKLSPITLLFPLLFVPQVWQHLSFLTENEHQIKSGKDIFSLSYIPGNAAGTFEYLRAAQQKFAMAAPIFYLAVLGLVWALCDAFKNKAYKQPRMQFLFGSLFIGYIGISLMIWAYHLGNPTLNYNIRLGIVYLPVLVLLAAYFIHKLIKKGISVEILTILIIFSIFFNWPTAAQNYSICKSEEYRLYKQTSSYLDKHYPNKMVLLISRSPVQWSVQLYSSINFELANKNIDVMIEELRNLSYQDIILIQRVDKRTGQITPETVLDTPISLMKIMEMNFRKYNVIVSKLDKNTLYNPKEQVKLKTTKKDSSHSMSK